MITALSLCHLLSFFIFKKMRSLQTELIEKGFVKQEKKKCVSKKKQEHFTERELQELMGMYRDTFRRR